MGKLSGKVAVVTGASKGIGAAIAEELASQGAAVAVNYSSSKEAADRVVNRIRSAGGNAVAIGANVAKPDEVAKLFAESKKVLGLADILVNNAGVYQFLWLDKVTPEEFHRQFDLNVLGLLLASQEAARQFGDRGGVIINISSVAATAALPGGSIYSATKAAVDAITRVLAAELGSRKIRVNSVNPGMVETEGVRAAGIHESDFRKQVEAETPLGRIGQPGDIAPVVAFLASPDSAWVTGESLNVAGGNRG
jgi:3-oxoacyl-[acyl-carrier protein] reductase